MAKEINWRPINESAIYEPVPEPASQHVPQWFKDIPPEDPVMKNGLQGLGTGSRNRATVKRCTPFIDALTFGYMFSFPWDIEVVKKNGQTYCLWSVTYTSRQLMDLDQPQRSAGMPTPPGYISTPWRVSLPSTIQTPKGYSTLLTHPFNRYDLPFLTLSAVVDTDKSHRGMVANILLREDFEGIIERGTPVMQAIPFKREDWKANSLPFDTAFAQKHEYEVQSIVSRSYQRQFWTKKSFK